MTVANEHSTRIEDAIQDAAENSGIGHVWKIESSDYTHDEEGCDLEVDVRGEAIYVLPVLDVIRESRMFTLNHCIADTTQSEKLIIGLDYYSDEIEGTLRTDELRKS